MTAPKDFHALAPPLAGMARAIPRPLFAPKRFFVARSGVLTLAFAAFPPGILKLKRDIESRFPDLEPERPGSLWPKATLAALTAKTPLEPDEIRLLWEAAVVGDRCASGCNPLRVDALELVFLKNRALEGGGRRVKLPLLPRDDRAAPPEWHVDAVNAILDQWSEDPDPEYVKAIRRPGFRAGHYRSPHREATLIAPVAQVLHCIDAFREAVDRLLPDRYTWFEDTARHITLRSFGAHEDAD